MRRIRENKGDVVVLFTFIIKMVLLIIAIITMFMVKDALFGMLDTHGQGVEIIGTENDDNRIFVYGMTGIERWSSSIVVNRDDNWNALLACDYDGDGRDEILAAENEDDDRLFAYDLRGDEWGQTTVANYGHPVKFLACGNFDNDGPEEVIVVDSSGRRKARVYNFEGELEGTCIAGNGCGITLTDNDDYKWSTKFTVADFDGDGRDELVLRDRKGNLYSFEFNASGKWTMYNDFWDWDNSALMELAHGDFTNDGIEDLVLGAKGVEDAGWTVRILYKEGKNSNLWFTKTPLPITPEGVLQVGDFGDWGSNVTQDILVIGKSSRAIYFSNFSSVNIGNLTDTGLTIGTEGAITSSVVGNFIGDEGDEKELAVMVTATETSLTWKSNHLIRWYEMTTTTKTDLYLVYYDNGWESEVIKEDVQVNIEDSRDKNTRYIAGYDRLISVDYDYDGMDELIMTQEGEIYSIYAFDYKGKKWKEVCVAGASGCQNSRDDKWAQVTVGDIDKRVGE